jgi:hypothetical protein
LRRYCSSNSSISEMLIQSEAVELLIERNDSAQSSDFECYAE